MTALARVSLDRWRAEGRRPLLPVLARSLGVAVEGALERTVCRRWAKSVRAARREWTKDFGGEQYALGRAFYTHLETDRSALYFRDAARSDARVERHLPGMQAAIRQLFGELVGGVARPRYGFCGPGVHVFPAREKVARSGGVIHFDTEGLTPHHIERRLPALTLVLMLQPAAWGGGIRLWDVLYGGRDEATEDELASAAVTHRYGVGSALLMDSYRLHQIRPSRGATDRMSITLHAAQVDARTWDTWF